MSPSRTPGLELTRSDRIGRGIDPAHQPAFGVGMSPAQLSGGNDIFAHTLVTQKP